MDAPDPVAANADLWSTYIYQQWRPLLDLFGGRQTADALGARIAEAHAGAVQPAIDDMYADNASNVSRYIDAAVGLPEPGAPPPHMTAPQPAVPFERLEVTPV